MENIIPVLSYYALPLLGFFTILSSVPIGVYCLYHGLETNDFSDAVFGCVLISSGSGILTSLAFDLTGLI